MWCMFDTGTLLGSDWTSLSQLTDNVIKLVNIGNLWSFLFTCTHFPASIDLPCFTVLSAHVPEKMCF